jgi:hypothetical protein
MSMKNELKDALNTAFSAPEPRNKQAFLESIRPREVGTVEMLIQQARYIRTSVWLFALAIIAFALFGSWMQMEETKDLIPEIMPFLAAVSVLETRRSKKYGMIELEMVTRFSLRSVIFARMLVLGLLYLIILGITSPVIAVSFGGETIITAIQIVLPYLITMSICLQVERSSLGRKLEYASLAVATLVSAFMIWVKTYDFGLVSGSMELIENWGVLIVLSLTAVTVYEQWKTISNVEELA